MQPASTKITLRGMYEQEVRTCRSAARAFHVVFQFRPAARLLIMAKGIVMQRHHLAETTLEASGRINFHSLYQNYARELWAFVQRRVGREEAADVVQDTYLRVLQYGDKRQLENPRAYLYRVAANVATDHGIALKASNDRIEPEVDFDALDAPSHETEAVIAARHDLQRCLAALDELPPLYRHVFLLNRVDGMTQGEISESLDIPKRTVERYIAKALEHCLIRVQQNNV